MRHVFTLDNPPPKKLVGQDLSDSYFGGTLEKLLNIRRIDLTGCDLTNVTFVFCDGRDVKMADAKCYGVYCRHSRWEGAELPRGMGFVNHHEWIAEIIRAAAEGQTNTSIKAELQEVKQSVEDYTVSWNPTWQQFPPTLEVKAEWRKIFAPYPQLARRFERLAERFDVSR